MLPEHFLLDEGKFSILICECAHWCINNLIQFLDVVEISRSVSQLEQVVLSDHILVGLHKKEKEKEKKEQTTKNLSGLRKWSNMAVDWNFSSSETT